MARFNYMDLEFFRSIFKHNDLLDYTLDLQRHCIRQEEVIMEQTGQLAKAEGTYFIHETKGMREENQALYTKNGQLQGEIEKLKIEKEAMKQKYEAQIENLKANQVVEVVTEKKEDYRMKDRQRDRKGRLLPTGSSKESRKALCYRLVREYGMDCEDVAAEIGNISPASVRTYVYEYEREQAKALEDQKRKDLEEKKYNEYLKTMENAGVILDDSWRKGNKSN